MQKHRYGPLGSFSYKLVAQAFYLPDTLQRSFSTEITSCHFSYYTLLSFCAAAQLSLCAICLCKYSLYPVNSENEV